MELIELNNVIKKELRKDRASNKSFKEHLKAMLDLYIKCLEELSDVDITNETIKDAIVQANDSKKQLIEIFDLYLKGKITESIKKMNFLLKRIKTPVEDSISNISKDWFRARVLDKNNRKYNWQEMFHVPFQLRNKVANYRFSISGYPCLYLGSSILACWEEMKTPGLDDFCISYCKLVTTESIPVLNLTFPTDDREKLFGRKNYNYLLTVWPLIIACSIKTLNPDDPFKYEYVIPQVVMLAIRNNSNIYGVAFSSTQMNDSISEKEELHYNLAIPTRQIKDNGYCKKLAAIFKLTRGVPFFEAEIKNVFTSYCQQQMSVENERLVINTIGDNCNPYNTSKFRQLENYLKQMVAEEEHYTIPQ